MTTRARSLLLVGVLLLALTGCMKVDADLKVNRNETVSGTMLMAIDKKIATEYGQSPDQFREQIEKSIKDGAHEGVECKSYDDGTYIGSQCTLKEVKFSDMGGSDSGLTFEKDGDEFIVSGGTGGAGIQISAAEEYTKNKPQVDFKITMPGKITDHDDAAKVDGRTATYTDASKMTSIRLVSKADRGFPVWLIVLLVLLLLGGGGAVAFFVLKGRKGGGLGVPQWGGQQFPAAGQGGPQQGQPGMGQPGMGQPGPWGPQPWGGQPGQQFPGQQGPQGQPGPQAPQGQQPQGRQPQGRQPWGQPGPQQGYPGQLQPGQGAPQYPGQPGPYRGPQGQPGPGQQPPQQWGGQPPQAQQPYGGPPLQGPGPDQSGDA